MGYTYGRRMGSSRMGQTQSKSEIAHNLWKIAQDDSALIGSMISGVEQTVTNSPLITDVKDKLVAQLDEAFRKIMVGITNSLFWFNKTVAMSLVALFSNSELAWLNDKMAVANATTRIKQDRAFRELFEDMLSSLGPDDGSIWASLFTYSDLYKRYKEAYVMVENKSQADKLAIAELSKNAMTLGPQVIAPLPQQNQMVMATIQSQGLTLAPPTAPGFTKLGPGSGGSLTPPAGTSRTPGRNQDARRPGTLPGSLPGFATDQGKGSLPGIAPDKSSLPGSLPGGKSGVTDDAAKKAAEEAARIAKAAQDAAAAKRQAIEQKKTFGESFKAFVKTTGGKVTIGVLVIGSGALIYKLTR